MERGYEYDPEDCGHNDEIMNYEGWVECLDCGTVFKPQPTPIDETFTSMMSQTFGRAIAVTVAPTGLY